MGGGEGNYDKESSAQRVQLQCHSGTRSQKDMPEMVS